MSDEGRSGGREAAAVRPRPPRVVLVRAKSAGNVGSVARAMKNFGAGDLVLVAPRRYRASTAEAMAVHATDVLERSRRVDTLAEAIADCAWVVGTTCRGGSYRRHPLSPHEAAGRMVALGAAPVALVFGPEDHGLSNDDLKLCHEIVTIPTHADYASLNLAQAVLVCLYECFLARHPPSSEPAQRPARAAALERMVQGLGRALLDIGFLHGGNPEHIMFAIRRMFGRAHLDEREVAIWLGVARQISWFAGVGRDVAADKRRRGVPLK